MLNIFLLKITLCTIPLPTKKCALLPFCVNMVMLCNILKTLLSILLYFSSLLLGKVVFKRTITYLVLQINEQLSYIVILYSHCALFHLFSFDFLIFNLNMLSWVHCLLLLFNYSLKTCLSIIPGLGIVDFCTQIKYK